MKRFWDKVNKTDNCWLWTACCNRGYGQFFFEGKHVPAHRFSYEMHYGPAGDKDVEHECRNRACVRPDHLRLATRKENMENLAAKTGSASGVRGVSWDRRRKKWNAQVVHNGKAYHVGRFGTIEEAAAAATWKRLELFSYNTLDR